MDKIDAPRTEHIARMCSTDGEHSDVVAYNIMYDHARTLERELSAALARVAELEGALSELHRFAFEQHGLSSAWVQPLNQARAALKEKS